MIHFFSNLTETQFVRVLDGMLKGTVSAEQLENLGKAYDTKKNSTVNYKLFLKTVNLGK
jgi:Ca2+-binding EF-hand superfamily protein